VSDLKRVSLAAVVLIVGLRLAIGWQFLYEGLWKLDMLDSPNPWTAKGYLANAEGPYRDYFRSMVGDFPQGNDPDDLLWLQPVTVSEAWQDWQRRFADHYQLDATQLEKLARLLSGPAEWSVPVKELPPGIADRLANVAKARVANPKADLPDIRYENGKLIVGGSTPLKPAEISQLYGWVKAAMTERLDKGQLKPTLAQAGEDGQPILDENGQPVRMEAGVEKDFAAAVFALSQKITADLGFERKLRATLVGDPGRAGVYVAGKSKDWQMGTPTKVDDPAVAVLNYGEIQQYRDELHEYEAMRAQADLPHEFEHLSRLKTKLTDLRNKVIGPVKALDAELKSAARLLLTAEQVARGPLPPAATPLNQASSRAMWGLLVLGVLLLLGLATRVAALGGAVMLLMFYLVAPPWPGVPEIPGPEHSYIVNKNLIEIIALLAIAALPTGSWFGLDGVLRWLFGGRRERHPAPPAQ
jgi:uncharacterized membrane protein YphA (DoxX/SURF4 family)